MREINFFNTTVAPETLEYVGQVLDSTFLSEGKVVMEFEEALHRKLGIKNPVAVNSGTSALHLALAVAGIRHGDEVIIPAQTFIATGMAVLMQRAKPVFADIQYETGNISPNSIKEKISEKTKAIIPVHWGGYPCDLDEINNIAKKHNLVVIEDAAHALGAVYKDQKIGNISDFTAFSFQAIKHLTTADGGTLSCINFQHCRDAKVKRWFGISRVNSKPSIFGERIYDVSELGFKYHMNNISAAIGMASLEVIEEILMRHREVATHYCRELQNVHGLRLFDYKDDRVSSYWLFGMHVEKREEFIRTLRRKGVPSSVVHFGIDKNSIFSGKRMDLYNQRKFDKTQIHIPIHNDLTDEDVAHICRTIKNGW